jgi:hypothetical protein
VLTIFFILILFWGLYPNIIFNSVLLSLFKLSFITI